MTNSRAQMEQELTGALRCEVFGENVSTYTEQGGREETVQRIYNIISFRTGIQAECADQGHCHLYMRPLFYRPLVITQGPVLMELGMLAER